MVLMIGRGRLMLRTALAEPELPALQAWLRLFETAMREARRVADALLSVTDAKSKNAKSSLVRGTYDKLRGSAKKNVEDAVPRLAKLLEKHLK